MTEDLEARLSGLGGERPLPPELAARLETALLAAIAGPERAEPALVAEAAVALDGPRPLPAEVQARLEAALLSRRRPLPARAMQAVLAVAAVVALVVASVGLLVHALRVRSRSKGLLPSGPARTSPAP